MPHNKHTTVLVHFCFPKHSENMLGCISKNKWNINTAISVINHCVYNDSVDGYWPQRGQGANTIIQWLEGSQTQITAFLTPTFADIS